MSWLAQDRQRDDRGSALLLIVGFALVLMSLVAVVADVSAVLLARRGVGAAADGAASAAAQQLDPAGLGAGGLAAGLPLDPVTVAQAVAAYEQQVQATAPGTTLAVSVQGASATVTATRQVRLPLRAPGGPASATVTAVATVRSPVAAP